MNDKDFRDLCIGVVRKNTDEHLDKSDPRPEYDVFVVWQCKTL